MSDEARSEVSVRAEGPITNIDATMLRALEELRSRARLVDLLVRALAPLAYQWATLIVVSSAWGGILFVAEPTTPRLIGGVLCSLFLGAFAFLVQHRKGTT